MKPLTDKQLAMRDQLESDLGELADQCNRMIGWRSQESIEAYYSARKKEMLDEFRAANDLPQKEPGDRTWYAEENAVYVEYADQPGRAFFAGLYQDATEAQQRAADSNAHWSKFKEMPPVREDRGQA